MFNTGLVLLSKILSNAVKTFNLGNGSTWPGHIALKINKNIIKQLLNKSRTKLIIIAGTNGKTTTSKLITAILEQNGKSILQNVSGANLLNGIASTLLLNATSHGKIEKDFAIFEVDENALPLVLKELIPDYIVFLNLFRDQLDRYGEVNTIAAKWKDSLNQLPEKTTLILNADDPQIAYLGHDIKPQSVYFGLNEDLKRKEKHTDAVDSVYCPKCGDKLIFDTVTFSHLGMWHCYSCKLKRPDNVFTTSPSYPLPGMYNKYNTNAAVLLTKKLGIEEKNSKEALQDFKPAFGRQEELVLNGKHVRIFLSKNPTGFNESLRTVKELGANHILFVLNDRIPDGRDVSWIWDTDIENILQFDENITVSGDRAYDMGLRMKYALPSKFEISKFKFQIEEDLKKAVTTALKAVKDNETLFIIPTYSAMLETRKILTGKKIL